MRIVTRGPCVLTQLREANLTRHEQWNAGVEPVSLSFLSNELAGETGELCNLIKKLERERMGLPGSRANIESVKEEMADVVISLDLLASQMGVNLIDVIATKFNKTTNSCKLDVYMEE